MFIKFMHDEL
ncbi:hypothetical protein K1719_032848, partial [Acacia pycnantha]